MWGATARSEGRRSWSLSFNSRTPCGVRRELSRICSTTSAFQFTHPVWGATSRPSKMMSSPCCFNSRTPCGVRLRLHDGVDGGRKVSIHAPRVGCDGATGQTGAKGDVSIHAPRVGCDVASGYYPVSCWFQFTHPVWGVTACLCDRCELQTFQFTHPVWGATRRPRQWRSGR